MSFCSFAEGMGMYDVTPIENMFLLEYLPTAPGKFLRVYLYARMVCLHPELGDSMEEMAKALHMDVDSVYDAMDYWERQGLVVRMSDRPPTYAIAPMRSGAANANPMEADYYEYRDFNANLQALFGENPLHPKQYEMAYDWLNLLGFTQEAVLRMVEARVKKSRARKPDPYDIFKKVNDTALVWAERGVRTLEDVEQALTYDGRVDRTANAVSKQLALRRELTPDEKNVVVRWLDEWGFSHDQIIDACAETIKARNPTVAYLDSILKARTTGEDAYFAGLRAVLRELGETELPAESQKDWYRRKMDEGFEPGTILLAAAQCRRKRMHSFEQLVWMVDEWGKLGLHTEDAAQSSVKRIGRLSEEIRGLLSKCGSNRNPRKDDIAYYERWVDAYSRELIDYAAECARGMQLPIRYIDKLLSEWEKSGVKTVEEARMQHENRPRSVAAAAAPANPALNYEQRTHDETNYKSLFIDLDNYGNGGDEA